MRLLNSRSRQLELPRKPEHYAIVSHRWGPDSEEVLFTDIGDETRARSKGKGYDKIQGSCTQAIQDKLNYVWLDTCCIDRSSSTELGKAINSMYRWYQESDVCYAYLHDVSDLSDFLSSDWFTRGWTLQELIAPKVLRFFAKDWTFLGTREDLLDLIAEHTRISPEILRSGRIPKEVTISQKMFWAARRETTEVEDRAYSLLGVLGVTMVTNYGIGEEAFEDLQHRIIAKDSDPTLFAWHHIATPPEDVQMADPDSVSSPVPESALEPAPEQALEVVEGDINTPSYVPTGLLASSSRQYTPSYEISEPDFRRNYVDGIRDDSYRSYFSISNNLIHISLPIKHVSEKMWKAVLRCSFEPPDGDEPQRPLVIFLEEIHPWKYVRVHRVRDEAEQDGGDETIDTKSIPGSLERLSDDELHLEGYVLRDIDVFCRYGENISEDKLKPPPDDPDAPTDQTDAERIAQLPRHPPGVKTTNIIVCGEPGVATGRIVNLIIGDTVIKPLTDYSRETMEVTVVDGTLQSRNIRVFYIIGPKDPYVDLEVYHTSLQNMHRLVQQVKEGGGIHAIFLCMVGSRVTGAVESNYRLFYEYVCQKKVPVILIITGLGKTARMEDWWEAHSDEFEGKALLNHACITVLRGEDQEHKQKYENSAQVVQRLLIEFMNGEPAPKVFQPEDLNLWFVSMGRGAMRLLLPGQKRNLRPEVIAKSLRERVHLNDLEATGLAQQFFDEHGMEYRY